MVGLAFFVPAIFFLLAVADVSLFDVSAITPVITFAAFFYVIEDFFKNRKTVKYIVNTLGTVILLLAVFVFFYEHISEDNPIYPFATSFLTFMKNSSDFFTILSVTLVIIYKICTSNKTEKLEKLKEELSKEYSASAIQDALKIGQKAYVISEGPFKDWLIERRVDDAIYWTVPPHGVTSVFIPNNPSEKDLKFKIIPSKKNGQA